MKRPINFNIFSHVLTHIVRGLAICSEISSQPDNSAPIPDRSSKTFSTLRVLIVDDNDLVRATITRQVKKCTAFLTECEDGLKGLMAYQSAEPGYDLVIMDYQMPHMNGIDVVESIRKYEQKKGTTRAQILRTL